MRRAVQTSGILLLACIAAAAQKHGPPSPDSLEIARDAFWDIGPPFSYYDLIQITKTDDGVTLDQVLVTPHGDACFQPAKVEERKAVLRESMSDLLNGRDPCAIPEKELNREAKRCKNCQVFSGVNVTMQASCGGKERQLRMDILDRDIYGSHPQTPANTSWTMQLLSKLQDALGPGSEAEPMFHIGIASRRPVPDSDLVNSIRDGKYDDLFGKDAGVSSIVVEAAQPPPPPPSVEVMSVEPIAPTSSEAPIYSPIAIAAHVEGVVEVAFDVDSTGRVQDVRFPEGSRLALARLGVSDAMAKWTFPPSAFGKTEKAQIRFSMNCPASRP